jgi:hypothetical protein
MKFFCHFLLFLLLNSTLYSQPLNGIYQVGTGGSYLNLTSALESALQNGFSGPVIFELAESYNSAGEIYPLKIKAIPGSSGINNLTIRPSLSAGEIKLTSSLISTLILEGCSFTTINGRAEGSETDKLIIENTNTEASAIIISNDASWNNIKHLKIRGKGVHLILFGMGIFTGCNYNTISKCTMTSISPNESPDNGVSVLGSLIVLSKGNLVEECNINNFRSAGVYISGLNDSTTVRNNNFYQTHPVASNSISAIKYDAVTNLEIYGNRISGLTSSYETLNQVNGIYVLSLYGEATNTSRIYNNFISFNSLNEAAKSVISGIRFEGLRGFKLEIYHNTIVIAGEDDLGRSSFCINKQGVATQFDVYNNILVNERITMTCPGKQYCFYAPNVTGILSDYNNYHNGINPPFIGNWEGSDLYIIEDWKNISKADSHSTFNGVNFISPIDLHLSGASLGDILLCGTPLPAITEDIDNEPRNPLFPYKGADENLQVPLPVELINFEIEVSGGKVLLTWVTVSELNNYGFTVERRNGTNWDELGFIPGKGNSTELNSYTYTDYPGSGIFYYRIKQNDFNGGYNYSSEIKMDIDRMDFILHQNYPNPFNPHTTIEFSLSENSFTTLKIYNISGELIETLINKKLEKGVYSFRFGGNKLAAGVYLYELISGGKRSINKMSLIK